MSEGGNRGVQWELRGGRGVLLGTVGLCEVPGCWGEVYREKESRPLTLIHSPLLNERIGAQLEPHPEMWIAVGFLVGGIWGSWDGDGGPLRNCGSPRSRGGGG